MTPGSSPAARTGEFISMGRGIGTIGYVHRLCKLLLALVALAGSAAPAHAQQSNAVSAFPDM